MTTTHPFDDDKLREHCGLFGIIGHADAAGYATLGLHALQHRGQDAPAAQAVREFNDFNTPTGNKFSQEYEVYSQRFQREDFGEDDEMDFEDEE